MNAVVESNSSERDPIEIQMGNGQLVSMKTIQQIYSELTGKEEVLEKTYEKSFIINYEDLYQLNAKIFQITEQFNIVASSCSVTIYHTNNQKQIFSSFERFQIYDRTVVSPTEKINIEYDFLIIQPNTKKPQPYKIEISITSRSALIEKQKNVTGIQSHIFHEFITLRNARSEITHVDYSVARTFQIAITEWFDSLTENNEKTFIKLLKKYKYSYPFLLSILSIIFCSFFYIAKILPTSLSNHDIAFHIIIFLSLILLMPKISHGIGEFCATTVTKIHPASYLNLTRGDEILSKQTREYNKNNILITLWSAFFAIFLNILSNFLTPFFISITQ